MISNNNEQIEEYEIPFYTFISEEKEETKELKKNDVKGQNNYTFV